MSEVKTELGEELAEVVFQECPDVLKPNMGFEPKLKGPGPNLWISPSDLLIGKVCLKPPLTDKHIKALTHEGIVAIGYDIEMQYRNEMVVEKDKALEEQKEHLLTLAERVKRVAVKMARDEEQEECEKRYQNLKREFEEKLRGELDKLEHEMLEYQRNVVREAISECEKEWQVKMNLAVEGTTHKLTKKFLDDTERQKKKMEDRFRNEFKQQHNIFDCAINKEHESCETTMRQLRHCLECKNLANLMYVLCMERRKCSLERAVLEYKHKVFVEDLHKKIAQQNDQIQQLTEQNEQKQKQLDVREKCVLEILKQFQKFINYALRATPTQAEFLLDVRKMMLFEITQSLKEKSKGERPAKEILDWRTESTHSEFLEEESGLTLPDYHECLDEIIPPGQESDFLPSFYYKDKLYVNRNLQLMAAKGVDISETNVLWNKDVENLMRLLKASVRTTMVPPIVEDDEFSQSARLHLDLSFSRSSRKRSDERFEPPLLYCNLSGSKDANTSESRDRTDFIKKIIRASMDVELAPLDTTGLLATKDSLIKIRESRRSSLKEMASYGAEEVETNNMLMAVKESLETELETDSKKWVEGSVNFQTLDAIRIPDQLEIKRSAKSSRASVSGGGLSKTSRTSAGLMFINSIPSNLPPVAARKNSSRESKLLSVKDSLIIHRTSIISSHLRKSLASDSGIPTQEEVSSDVPRPSQLSKLSMAQDSLELIKKQSLVSRSSKRHSTIGAISEDIPATSRHVSPLTVSHIEVAQIPTNIPETAVNFSPIAEVYEVNLLKNSDSPWKIYEEPKASRDNFLTKPDAVQVTGDPQSKEHIPGSPSFAEHRINSLMDILRQDASLMRLFTSGTK